MLNANQVPGYPPCKNSITFWVNRLLDSPTTTAKKENLANCNCQAETIDGSLPLPSPPSSSSSSPSSSASYF